MRELKFRAYESKDKTWFYTGQGAEIHNDWLESDDNWHVMQYTGLKDKNGKEIFEGDIVRLKYWSSTGCPCPNCGYVADGAKSFEVKFDRGAFGLDASPEFEDLIEFGDKREIEVIGNIYENPELLK